MRISKNYLLTLLFLLSFSILNANSNIKKIAYIVSDTSIPFWNIMSRGVKNSADVLG